MRKVVILFLGLFLLAFVVAQETNFTDQEYSRQCLFDSNGFMDNLAQEGFSILRINDTLTKARIIYDSQVLAGRQGKAGEYGFVIDSCEEISVLHELAFKSRDDLRVFKEFLADTIVDGMNTESIDKIVAEIEKEIHDERYEKVEPLIEGAYAETSRVQEEYSRLSRFYTATTRNIVLLLKGYGVYLGSLLVVLFIFYLAYRVRIRKVIINRKIQNLRLRKKSIQNLMETTQKEYFQTGKISESDYNLRSKNFANLIRDIDRQIPLLEEKLIKVRNSNNSNDVEKDLREEVKRKQGAGKVEVSKREEKRKPTRKKSKKK